ncbi:MAG: Na+:solute symporter, partial [Rhodothermales bacterium]|nr:Na+:solute symporter [Rhodothermales bacterium]
VLTDLEFYELRYSGRPAAFLRGFRAIYLGVFFNVLIMATVSLAMIKIAGVMLNLTPVATLLIASSITVVYSALGGLRGVLITDFIQFGVAMIGAIGAAVVAVNLPEIGGMSALLTNDLVMPKLNLVPILSDKEAWISLLILPLAVQWWSVWYPGAEPGGGGYIAQRMLSAKDEKNAMGAVFLFNAAHYALRPWPWIIVALCSIVVFPDLDALAQAFPNLDPSVIGHDLAYPAMLTYLPTGLLGLVIASLIAAFMSTISTHLNWGSSYVVNDFYLRFVNAEATDKQQVLVGRISTFVLMAIAAGLALLLSNALQAFNILLQIGAGTGLLFILRWFWWRINPWSEITAMVVSFLVALYFAFVHTALGFEALSTHMQLLSGVLITTIAWVAVTILTRPSESKTLASFYNLIQPGGPGWSAFLKEAKTSGVEIKDSGEGWEVPTGILCMVFGSFSIYAALFSVGHFIYGNTVLAVSLAVGSCIAGAIVAKLVVKLQAN